MAVENLCYHDFSFRIPFKIFNLVTTTGINKGTRHISHIHARLCRDSKYSSLFLDGQLFLELSSDSVCGRLSTPTKKLYNKVIIQFTCNSTAGNGE